MTHLSDEWLARRAQIGDVEAEAILAARYHKLADQEASSWSVWGHSHEDLAATMRLGLVKAIRSYEEGKGTKFKTYAKRIMRRDLTDLWRAATAKSRIPGNRVSGEVIGEDKDGEAITLERNFAAPVDYEARAIASVAAGDLVERLLGVVRGVLEGMARGDYQKETAEALGLPESLVANMIANLRSVAVRVAPGLAPY